MKKTIIYFLICFMPFLLNAQKVKIEGYIKLPDKKGAPISSIVLNDTINKLNKLKNYFLIKENLNKNFKKIYIKIAELIFLKKTSLRKPLIIGLAG